MIINPKLTNGKVLFDGYNTSNTITLNDNFNNYSVIEIVTSLQGSFATHRLYTNVDYRVNLTDIMSSNSKWQQVRILRGTFNGNTLTLDKLIGININMENFTFSSFEPEVECIRKIIGYK